MLAFDQYKLKAKTALRKFIPDRWVRRYNIHKHGKNYLPAVGKINFGDLRRLKPMSKDSDSVRGGPIDRYYIEKFLYEHSPDIRGNVLEVGDNRYTLEYGKNNVAKSDVLDLSGDNKKATVIADLTDARHIPSNAYDCVILTHCISIIYNYYYALRTVHRILKRSGVLLLTSGVGFQIQPNPHNDIHWNISDVCFRKILSEFFPADKIITKRYGNILAMSCFLYGIGRTELDAGEYDFNDIDFPVIFGIRAVKE
jgi:hypothetical protein